jgi:hypothetical protein
VLARAVRLPIEVGKGPVTLLPLNVIAVTRFAVTVIPNHVLTGALSQFVLSVQLAPFVLLYKSTKASESLVSTVGCAFAQKEAVKITSKKVSFGRKHLFMISLLRIEQLNFF